MRIGIELNNIIRDINSQLVKYYKKGIDKNFDEGSLNTKELELQNKLPFKSKKMLHEFMYVDYPFEIFGCAMGMDRNISNAVNSWIIDLENREDDNYGVSFFSLKENALSIQSTYYFLSKMGTRVREMFFPKDGKDMWDLCDVIITTNERIVMNRPLDKRVVLIRAKGNEGLEDMCDLVYDDFISLTKDSSFFDKLFNDNKKTSLLNRFIIKLKKIF